MTFPHLFFFFERQSNMGEERERERQVMHPLAHSQDTHSSQVWTRKKPRARNSIWVDGVGPVLGLSPATHRQAGRAQGQALPLPQRTTTHGPPSVFPFLRFPPGYFGVLFSASRIIFLPLISRSFKVTETGREQPRTAVRVHLCQADRNITSHADSQIQLHLHSSHVQDSPQPRVSQPGHRQCQETEHQSVHAGGEDTPVSHLSAAPGCHRKGQL